MGRRWRKYNASCQNTRESSSIDTEDLKKPIPNFAEVSEQDRKPVVKLDNFDTENEQTQSQISTFQSRSENMFSDDSPFPDSSFDDQSSFPLSVDLKYGDTKILQKSVSRGWTPGHYPTDLTWEELQEIRKSGRRLTAKEIVIENIHRLMKNPKTIEKGISLMLRCEEHNRKVDAAIAAVEAARRRQFPSTVPAGCIPPVNPPVSDSKPPNVSISIQNGKAAAASATAAPVAAEPKKFRTEWIIRLPHNGRGPKL